MSGACSSAQEGENGSSEDALATADVAKHLLDVNDVSVLFPIGPNGTPLPEIKMSDVDDQGAELFSGPNFAAVTDFATNTSQSGIKLNGEVANRASWRVVGMRFDPCAPTSKVSAEDPTKLEKEIPLGGGRSITECIAQMRLIVQPFTGGADFDTTAHLVFSLATPTALGGKDKYLAVMKQLGGLLAEIKDASAASGGTTVGRTLGVHPGLAKDAASVGPLVTKFIQKTAGLASRGEAAGAATKSIAFMGLRGGAAEPWAFFAGRVGSKDKWAPVPLPTTPTVVPGVQVISFLASPAQRVTPAGATQPLFEASRDAAIIKRVDDAADAHFFNMDCVSCHTSGSRTQLTSGLAIADALFPSPKGITGYVRQENSQSSSWNVRNFGYFRGKPTVASRAVTETVDVVRYMNTFVLPSEEERKQLAKTGFVGPARDCTEVESTVAQCFLKGGSDDDSSPEGQNGKCTAQCKGFATGLKDDPEPIEPVAPKPIVPDPAADLCTSAQATLEISADGRSAVLGGEKAKCLAVSLGSFRSLSSKGAVTEIVCPESGRCVFKIPSASAATLQGSAATRLFTALRVTPTAGVK
ncbi:MAG TPA: hypothetical protein VLT33_03745, partial [Labilithrix sp.]|nr:hypothetical protein [Labilithrix sp.]